jgi:hypothetical protein
MMILITIPHRRLDFRKCAGAMGRAVMTSRHQANCKPSDGSIGAVVNLADGAPPMRKPKK